jgi:hypothetical protein
VLRPRSAQPTSSGRKDRAGCRQFLDPRHPLYGRSSEGLPTCQHIRATRVDAAVADAFQTALAPAELDALSRARRAQVHVETALRTSAERQLERKRYAAALAERQFNRVDPDNRLVAAELERQGRRNSSGDRS